MIEIIIVRYTAFLRGQLVKKYMHFIVLLISINSFCLQGENEEVSPETTWKEALGYIAIVTASAGAGAACAAYDAHYFGPKKDSLISGINAISGSKEKFEKGFSNFAWNALLPFGGALTITGLMWGFTFDTRSSLVQGTFEDSRKNWVKRSLGLVSFWSSWAAYIAVYALLRKKNPVALNIDNFKNWK